MNTSLYRQAETLVQNSIKGHRKGLPDEPAFLHSFRVADRLRRHGVSDDVLLAGLLHDVIEDGGVTEEDLRKLGCSDRVIALVRLCSHDQTIENTDLRWIMMVMGLVKAQDADAWSIKLADIADNLREPMTIAKDRAAFMRDVKLPTLLHASQPLLGHTTLWREVSGLRGANLS